MYQNQKSRFTKRNSYQGGTSRNLGQERRSNFAHDWQNKNPEIFAMASFIRRNSEVSRHVSLGIINVLRSNGIIPEDAKAYVAFYLNRFSVKVNGLATEYLYTEPMFIKAFYAAATSINVYFVSMINDYTVRYEDEPLKESSLNTPEYKEETKSLSVQIIEHVTDTTVTVEEPKDDTADK